MKEELLEYIFVKTEESCLSDLKVPSILNEHIKDILSIENDTYSLEEWQSLYEYITNHPINSTGIQDIKDRLVAWAKEK